MSAARLLFEAHSLRVLLHAPLMHLLLYLFFLVGLLFRRKTASSRQAAHRLPCTGRVYGWRPPTVGSEVNGQSHLANDTLVSWHAGPRHVCVQRMSSTCLTCEFQPRLFPAFSRFLVHAGTSVSYLMCSKHSRCQSCMLECAQRSASGAW
ncbi:unnamed protein product [Prorocentrum cordatum]|uniref:Secreted protein n=1 Tax=Prorocentrum cordatum TaxID=2364126 RepID=A0ABN9VAK8_9DINO|nr:unnamed protein product [Polarella glacialis]